MITDFVKYNRDRRNKSPWLKTYYAIGARCNNPKNKCFKYYGERGIKRLITVEELKFLWFRDKAYLMLIPTIDRKNNDGDYTFENCRYLEMGLNSAERNTRVSSKPVLQFDLRGNFIKEWPSVTSATKFYNNQTIGRAVIGKAKIASKFIWKLK